jgi:sec-independent protein translocase protein TatA
MPNIGPMELIIVLVIVLLVFGPKRLPGLGKQLGTGMREFKDSINGKDRDDDDDEDERPRRKKSSSQRAAIAKHNDEDIEPAESEREKTVA